MWIRCASSPATPTRRTRSSASAARSTRGAPSPTTGAKAIDQQRADLKEQSLALSRRSAWRRRGWLQKTLADYDQFVQSFWGPKGRATELNEQLTADVIQRVRTVVERVARDDSYDLVLDAGRRECDIRVKSLDLTDRVLDILNREAGTPASGPPHEPSSHHGSGPGAGRQADRRS